MGEGTCTITVHFNAGEPPFTAEVEFAPPMHEHCRPHAINGAVHVPTRADADADAG